MTTLAGYQLRLPSFEGPLDVLLSLIERNRLEISDLSLVAVTDGFLAYVEDLCDPPPTLLAEFAGVAARLLLLKSRSLLPRPASADVEAEVADLAEQLREYQRAKQVASALREIEHSGWRAFARPPITDMPSPKIVLIAPAISDLRRSLLRVLSRVRPEPEVAPLRRVIAIGEMVDRFRSRLGRVRRAARFRDLVGTTEREEHVVGFIALLALLRHGEVEAEQHELFGDIHVMPAQAASGGDQ